MELVFIALVVIAGIALTATFYNEGSGWTPKSAAFQITIRNETDQNIINASGTIWVIIPAMLNLTSLPSIPSNLSVTYYHFDEYKELGLQVNYLSLREAITLRVTDIYVPENSSADLGEDGVKFWITQPPTGIACSALLQVWGATPFGGISLGSSYNQQVTGADIYSGSYTDRYNVRFLYSFLYLLTIIILTMVALSVARTRVKGILPFTTLLIAWFSVFLYVFVGSSWEIAAASSIPSLSLLLAPCVFLLVLLVCALIFIYEELMHRPIEEPESYCLRRIVYRALGTMGSALVITVATLASLTAEIHGSYYHLTSNLAFLLIIGCAIEWISGAGIANSERNPRRFILFFLVPLILPPPILSLLGLGGVGLSLAIEVMALLFWVYVVVNRESIAESRYKMVAVYGSGLALAVFYGWFIEIVTGLATGYDVQEANLHFWTTIVAIVLLLVFYAASIKGKYKRRIKEAFNTIFENRIATDHLSPKPKKNEEQ